MSLSAKKASVHVVFPDDLALIIGTARDIAEKFAATPEGQPLDSRPLMDLWRAVSIAFSTAIDAKPGEVICLTLASLATIPPPERAFQLKKINEQLEAKWPDKGKASPQNP